MDPDELNRKVDITGNFTLYYNGNVTDSRRGQAQVPLITLLQEYYEGQRKLANLEKGLAGLRKLIIDNTDSCPFCLERRRTGLGLTDEHGSDT